MQRARRRHQAPEQNESKVPQAYRKRRRRKRRSSLNFIFFFAGIILLGIVILLLFRRSNVKTEVQNGTATASLMGQIPVLPIFTPIPDAEQRMVDLLQNSKPTLAGIAAILQRFVLKLHESNVKLSSLDPAKTPLAETVVNSFFGLAHEHLRPFEQVYQGRIIFPIRDDDSIFLSLAAFREHLLADTLEYAFTQAKHPERLFVGAVVQNCFGRVINGTTTIDTSGKPCKTGAQVIGKNAKGKDMVKVSDAPPDPNGIADFCAKFPLFCKNQVRVLYVHETESLGPAMARYYASKLWGGETFYIQCDSHLQFAEHWDGKYIQEIRATLNYPKSILSSYPPGFQEGHTDGTVKETSGARLCTCETLAQDPNPVVRITNGGRSYQGTEPRPTQIPFMAAGFFFTHASFLKDIPFDPYLPWCFMGEEIALSMRAWTSGWNMYAPRKNYITHQYRPGRMGLPKFWGTVNRLYGGGAWNNRLQSRTIQRIKYLVGYPRARQNFHNKSDSIVLTDLEQYGLGRQRALKDYLEFAHLTIDEENDAIVCSNIEWCNLGTKE
mmetsp:Transcript_12793/g.19827  ORF Transcript_12793/g.19827 Transcript_12793/m.19827 type:complete len:552 (+) Transcript_12793:61-1716(+)